jgi:SAM-dependent methyltransferase
MLHARPKADRRGRLNGATLNMTVVESVPGCGVVECGLDHPVSVRDAGMDFVQCPICHVLRIPPGNLKHYHVLPDPPGKLSLLMRLLMSLRMMWLTREVAQLRDKNCRIADVGCGDGQFLEFLRARGYDRAFGIEPDEARAKNAQLRNVPLFLNRADVEVSGQFETSMDVIFVWHVLEHIERPAEFLVEYLNWLASSGVMVISVPNQASVQTKLFGYFSAFPDYGRHIWYHKPDYIIWFTRSFPGFVTERMRDLNYEYEVFSWVDSLASVIMRQQNFFHRAIKKGEGGKGRRLLAAAMGIGLLPIAGLLAPLSLALGRGSTLTFSLRRKLP